MLLDGVRFCDVCKEPIESGARYARCTIPKDTSVLFTFLVSKIDAPVSTGNPEGSLKLEACLECKLNLDLSGEIVI